MSCSDCRQTIFTSDFINKSLKQCSKCLIPGDRTQNNRPDTMIPLSTERLNMAAYTFTYHMKYDSVFEKDPFWGNTNVCEPLLKYRFEEHSASHSMSCFKKGCECRFLFPFMSANCTYIHEDTGEQNEKETLWYSLDGSRTKMYSFIVLPK